LAEHAMLDDTQLGTYMPPTDSNVKLDDNKVKALNIERTDINKPFISTPESKKKLRDEIARFKTKGCTISRPTIVKIEGITYTLARGYSPRFIISEREVMSDLYDFKTIVLILIKYAKKP